jgi:WD40 repeat protein
MFVQGKVKDFACKFTIMIRPTVEKLHTLRGHSDCVYTLVAGPSEHEFFSAGGDGFVVMWDLHKPETGRLIAKVSASVYALHFDKASNELIIGQNYEGIQIVNVKEMKVIGSVKITSAAIFDIQRIGNDIFVATGDGVVIVVDRQTMAVRKHIKASDKSARTMAIDASTNQLAVGYSDNNIRLFGLRSFEPKALIKGHENSVFTLQFQGVNADLISAGRDANFKVWDGENNYQPKHSVVAHMFAINHLDFSPDNKHFVTCSMDKSIKIWDAQNYKLLKVIDKSRHAGHGTSVNRLLWTDYQNQVISASDDRTLSVWQINFPSLL